MNLPILLVVSPFPTDLLQTLESDFEVIQWSQLSDPAVFCSAHGERVSAVIVSGAIGLPQGTTQHFTNLDLIACNGVGYDAIDMTWVRKQGIRVTNTPDVLSGDVADLALALLLAVFRQIPASDRFVRDGAWERGPMPLGRRLAGSRIGIAGLGRIGRLIANRCTGFDTVVGYCGRSLQSDAPYEYFTSPGTLAEWADVLIVATPGGAQTRHLISAEVLRALGPGGVLINVARGSVVDEAALINSLQSGRLAGAGLDVFADEPHVPQALLALPRVVLTPHIASATVQTRRAMAELVVANLRAFHKSEPLPNSVE